MYNVSIEVRIQLKAPLNYHQEVKPVFKSCFSVLSATLPQNKQTAGTVILRS